MGRTIFGVICAGALLTGSIGATFAAKAQPPVAMDGTQCSKFHMPRPDITPTAADLGRCGRPALEALTRR